MAKAQFKIGSSLLYGFHALRVAVGGGKGFVFGETEVEEIILGLGATELDDFLRHQFKIAVVEAAQSEPNLGMAGGNAKSFFAQDGVRDDKGGQRLYGFQLLAFFL